MNKRALNIQRYKHQSLETCWPSRIFINFMRDTRGDAPAVRRTRKKNIKKKFADFFCCGCLPARVNQSRATISFGSLRPAKLITVASDPSIFSCLVGKLSSILGFAKMEAPVHKKQPRTMTIVFEQKFHVWKQTQKVDSHAELNLWLYTSLMWNKKKTKLIKKNRQTNKKRFKSIFPPVEH